MEMQEMMITTERLASTQQLVDKLVEQGQRLCADIAEIAGPESGRFHANQQSKSMQNIPEIRQRPRRWRRTENKRSLKPSAGPGNRVIDR